MLQAKDKLRIRLHELLVAQFNLNDEPTCAHRADDADYCAGPTRYEWATLPSEGGDMNDPDNIQALCTHHSDQAVMFKERDAFIRDHPTQIHPRGYPYPGGWIQW
ncbi:hypothetical protein [Corynebacterium nuruki]|uniref:hypothetical protein n=1 Tax=Corynebacterium nuruki TaxID=1032851 RepID=UPI0039BF57FE